MLRTMLAVTVFALVVGSGLIQGLWTKRWDQKDDFSQAKVDRMHELPMTIGDWDGRAEDIETLPKQLRDVSITRTYVHRVNGSVVSLFLTHGPKGPLCFNHTPLGCYPGHGYLLNGEETRYQLADSAAAHPAEFWTARFSKTETSTPHHVRVFWSWSGSGAWLAPESPRLAFAGFSGLYKLYITRELVWPDEPFETDPMIDFARMLMPELHKALFANPNS